MSEIRTNNFGGDRFRFKMFNATFNTISAISWRSVLLVEETGVPGKNHLAAICTAWTVSCKNAKK